MTTMPMAAVPALSSPSDCPRTHAAQDASWHKHGNHNNYMRMIDAYVFASQLERELAISTGVWQRLDELLRRCREERHTPTYADLLTVRGVTP